jgi:hypothetical protein
MVFTFQCRRVYLGNSQGEQVTSFKNAIGRVVATLADRKIGMTVDYMSLKTMRDKGLSFADVIDWLLGSHLHFVITHPHQGLESSGWSIVDIYQQVKRLWYHPGFPAKEKLKCPIFCQDKHVYVFRLSLHEMSIPTLCINLQDESSSDLELWIGSVNKYGFCLRCLYIYIYYSYPFNLFFIVFVTMLCQFSNLFSSRHEVCDEGTIHHK